MSAPPIDARWVEVRSAVAPLLAEAGTASTQISQRLAGHRLEVLDVEEDWLLVRGHDAYEGWVHRGYVAAADGGPAGADARRLSLGCVVESPGLGWARALPLGAVLDPAARVVAGEAVEAGERARRFPRDRDAIARTAVDRFAGTYYEWGGITPWGADCSGLVQSSFALHSVPLPRDAWQQASVGEDAGSDLSALQPADLLFFSDRDDGRITHVAISLGDLRIVHLALGRGGYAVEDLRDEADPYVTKLHERFRFARRPGV
ncbi:MAG: C40 family peptidase [Gemmatimonadaceae bacterium]